MKRASLAFALLACGGVACTSDATRDRTSPSPLLGFHVVGCSRDFPGPDSLRTRIERDVAGDTVGFVVRHPDACGLRAGNPSFVVEGGVLQLRYDLETQDGMHLMCECEYRATFRFDRSMERIEWVRFGEEPAQRVR